MRTRFEHQLSQLNVSLIEMGGLVERAIQNATKALVTQDTELAKSIIAFDSEINEKEKEIESLCLKIILQQQPVAKDLKLVTAALKMITDLERIGDHAADISEITLLLEEPYKEHLHLLPKLADATIKMVKDSIDAFVNTDVDLATQVIDYDDVVDGLFVQTKEHAITLIREDEENAHQAIDFIMIAKYFERIGDHATNIAEWVVFSCTGIHKHTKVI